MFPDTCDAQIRFQSGACLFFSFFFFLFGSFSAAPAAYGGSLTRGRIRAVAARLHPSHSHAGSLTHWARPGIEGTSSWILVRFISTEPRRELHLFTFSSGAFHRARDCNFHDINYHFFPLWSVFLAKKSLLPQGQRFSLMFYSLSFIFIYFLKLYWRWVDLLCCVNFCRTTKWFGYTHFFGVSFTVSAFIFRPMIHFKLGSVWCEIRVEARVFSKWRAQGVPVVAQQ